jgi:hypothetical protein
MPASLMMPASLSSNLCLAPPPLRESRGGGIQAIKPASRPARRHTVLGPLPCPWSLALPLVLPSMAGTPEWAPWARELAAGRAQSGSRPWWQDWREIGRAGVPTAVRTCRPHVQHGQAHRDSCTRRGACGRTPVLRRRQSVTIRARPATGRTPGRTPERAPGRTPGRALGRTPGRARAVEPVTCSPGQAPAPHPATSR